MIAAIQRWWTGQSRRERWLVGIAAVLAVLVGGWLLVLVPLKSALSSAQVEHARAVDRHAAIATRAAAIEAAQARPRTPRAADGAAAASLELAITQSATEAGFTLSRSEARGNDEVAIAIANGRARALLDWIDRIEQTGVVVSDLSLRPNSDSSVALTATLRRLP